MLPMSNFFPSVQQKALAWGVHVFTASGLVSGFMALLAVKAHDWQEAMAWLVLCQIIDGVDGALARAFSVKEVLPYMDGQTIDYVIDFATYAIIPAFLFYEAELVTETWRLPCTALILLVSALYYGKKGMVSEDKYFVGFPVMWNMVIFYLIFVAQCSALLNGILIVFFAILHFVPIKFVYPSRGTRFSIPTIIVTLIFIATLISLVWYYPQRPLSLIVLAWSTLAYYTVMAVYNTWWEG